MTLRFKSPSYFILPLLMMASALLFISQSWDVEAIPSEPDVTRLNGRIVSLQFSDDGSASWIVSGRWRVDINYDINGVILQSIKI